MRITTTQPETKPIPVKLSAPEFTAFILPHLSMPKRGPKCKLGYYRFFNLVLWVLYTGMQWKCLPIPQDPDGKPAIHYTTVYRVFAKWGDASAGGRARRHPAGTRRCRRGSADSRPDSRGAGPPALDSRRTRAPTRPAGPGLSGARRGPRGRRA